MNRISEYRHWAAQDRETLDEFIVGHKFAFTTIRGDFVSVTLVTERVAFCDGCGVDRHHELLRRISEEASPYKPHGPLLTWNEAAMLCGQVRRAVTEYRTKKSEDVV